MRDHNQTNKWLKRRLDDEMKEKIPEVSFDNIPDVAKNILLICWMWCRTLYNKLILIITYALI